MSKPCAPDPQQVQQMQPPAIVNAELTAELARRAEEPTGRDNKNTRWITSGLPVIR